MARTDLSAETAEQARQLICQANFHRCLFVPKSSTHERLRVTFSVSSNFDDVSLPVMLFCGPMFASRYHAAGVDNHVKTARVRVIQVDRPGFGGSTPVPLEKRITWWLELVPVLLEKLSVKHVSLVSHSAGTVYLLNTLWHHRQILDPAAPYVAMVCPWVESRYSGVALMALVDKVPSGMMDAWSPIMRFALGKAMPAGNWSGGVFSSVSGLFKKPSSTEASKTAVDEASDVDALLAKQIEKLQVEFMITEDTSGLNDEARTCVRKGGVDWGICSDYPKYAAQLLEREMSAGSGKGAKLKIDVFFAESDIMIGKGGQAYFTDCWKQVEGGDAIDYKNHDLTSTTHETAITDAQLGALGPILEHIGRSSSAA